jgi:hypothetical protein
MDIITFIKVGRLKWAGHAVRMDQQRPAKIIFNEKLKVQEGEEDLNSGGKMEWIRMSKLWEKETGRT